MNSGNILKIWAFTKLISYSSFQVTAVFRLVVQKSRREFAHARPFGGDFELKILRMRGFSSRFLDNQPEMRFKVVKGG